jgi:carbon starvation protein CstA
LRRALSPFDGRFNELMASCHSWNRLYLYDHSGRPWISFAVANQICVVVLLAAVVCGIIAMRRGSKWWALTVAPALLFAVIYYFGDL